MPSVTASDNGICYLECGVQNWPSDDGNQCAGLSERRSCNSGMCRTAFRHRLNSWPNPEQQCKFPPTPSPQTPPTRIRHKPQLARHRQRSPVLPRRTVKRNAPRRPHRQRPRRRHLRAEPPPPIRLRRLQTSLCRLLRTPRTEADAHRMTVLHHRHYRRSPRYLRSRPPRKMARQQRQRIHMHRCASGCSTVLGKLNAGPAYTSPPTSVLYRSACTGASRKSVTGGSALARPSSSSAIPCGTSARTAQAHPVLPRISANRGPGSGSGSRVPRIRPALSNRTACEGEGRACSQDHPKRRHRRASNRPTSPRSTDSSRSRIWIVSDNVSTSLQPSQSTHTYSTQT